VAPTEAPVQPAPNNTALYIGIVVGIGIVAGIIVALVLKGKKK
jgi:ABC-type sugar transport system permease subunit